MGWASRPSWRSTWSTTPIESRDRLQENNSQGSCRMKDGPSNHKHIRVLVLVDVDHEKTRGSPAPHQRKKPPSLYLCPVLCIEVHLKGIIHSETVHHHYP